MTLERTEHQFIHFHITTIENENNIDPFSDTADTIECDSYEDDLIHGHIYFIIKYTNTEKDREIENIFEIDLNYILNIKK